MSPMAPRRPCRWPGCPALISGPGGFCPEHQRAEWRLQNARRDPALRNFYDSREWKALRTAYKTAHPLCEVCLSAGRETLAQQVDHVIPVRQAPDRALDATNLRALCVSCHSSATLTERHRRARGER